MTHYKVLVNAASCHGGDFDWTPYLPAADEPGPWTPAIEQVRVCETGYHLTTDPMRWPKVGMTVYETEGRGSADEADDKTAFASVRLLRPAPETIPAWWRDVEAFVATIPQTPWFQPQGDPNPTWRLFDTRAAAGDAAWAAAWDAARAAARDAALMAQVLVCAGLPLDQRHIDHARARWAVWQRGYGLLGDVDGVLYVYRRP